MKANQLIDNVTTNLAESWMHIRAKFDGGKVINRCQSGSWEHRCMGAGLQQNIGREWGPGVWKKWHALLQIKFLQTQQNILQRKLVKKRNERPLRK